MGSSTWQLEERPAAAARLDLDQRWPACMALGMHPRPGRVQLDTCVSWKGIRAAPAGTSARRPSRCIGA